MTHQDDQAIRQALEAARSGGRPCALATVVATKGSTPRKVGARMVVDPQVGLTGTVEALDPLDGRPVHPDLAARAANLPDDTRLWAALQARSGGSWGGCVHDVDSILAALDSP